MGLTENDSLVLTEIDFGDNFENEIENEIFNEFTKDIKKGA